MACAKCGKELKAGKLFCVYCGHKNTIENKILPTKTPGEKNYLVFLILGVLFILLGFISSIEAGLTLLWLAALITGAIGLIKGSIKPLGIRNRKAALPVFLGSFVVLAMLIIPHVRAKKAAKPFVEVKQRTEQTEVDGRERIEEYYQKGINAINGKDWDKAEKYFNEVKKIDVNYKELNKYFERIKLEKTPLEERYVTEHMEELYQKGISALTKKNYDEAKNCFKRIEKVNPNYKNVKKQLAAISENSNGEQEDKYAVEHTDKLYQKGISALTKYNPEEAKKCFERIENVKPNYKDVKQLLTKISRIIETKQKAARDASEAEYKAKLESEYEQDNGMAFLQAREFVRRELKTHSMVKFPWSNNVGDVAYLGERLYRVSSYVDSKDPSGTLIRSEYVLTIKDNGNDKWQVESYSIKP